MIRRLLILSVFCMFLPGYGQISDFCGTTQIMNKWLAENPEKAGEFLRLQEEAAQQDALAYKNNYAQLRMQAATVYTIPVVFHVLHLNGSENISDAQVIDAVNILNRDYRKLNADTSTIVSEFKALAADVNFEFRLATKDEYGNCTNGIVRHYNPKTNWDVDFSNYIYTWNPSMYLNIYIVKTITSGAAGYAFLPGTPPAMADAIVIRHDYIGSIGTSNPYTSRALTHEVGHWFNLQHVWGSTNNPGVACGDDGVSDTPITKGFGWCNLNGAAVCTPPNKENVQNYMDYSYCPRMFTIGQANRMTNCILGSAGGRNNLPTNSNLIATGVISPVSPCAPIANFIANKNEVCLNTSVAFTDLSYNAAVTNWQWTFPDGNVSLSSLQNPTTTFTASGLKAVQLKVANSIGADSIIKKLVTVLPGAGSGTTNIAQGFESITFPDNSWIANIPVNGMGWIQTNTVGASSSKCVMIDNYFDSPSDPCHIYTPMYDVSTLPNPALTFDVAYSQNTSGSFDKLKVYYSVDCAVSWNTLYSKGGNNLHTLGTGIYASGAFVNPQGGKWRKETVSLSTIATASNVLFKFEFERDSVNPGNNIYLDNINLETASGIAEEQMVSNSIHLYPNPAQQTTALIFNSPISGLVELSIKDVTGKEIIRYSEKSVTQGENIVNLNLKGLARGLYFVQITIRQKFYLKKLIVD